MTDEAVVRTGGCRCGRLRYEVAGDFAFVFNCHCRFCRHVHGAAFVTVAIVPRATFRWSPTSGEPSRFVTLRGSVRHFCETCASPVCNPPTEPELLCLVVASLDLELEAAPWAHLNTESKAPWFEITDGLPPFATSPNPSERKQLARRNRRSV